MILNRDDQCLHMVMIWIGTSLHPCKIDDLDQYPSLHPYKTDVLDQYSFIFTISSLKTEDLDRYPFHSYCLHMTVIWISTPLMYI